MLSQIDKLITDIERSDYPSLDLISVDLVETFETFYAPKLGKLMLSLKRKRVSFDNLAVVEVEDFEQAFRLVKLSNTYEEKVVYALMFLGLFNRAAQDGVDRILETLVGRGVANV